MAVADEIDRLYELPLGEFTKARNELAARLKKGGDAAGAADVRALAKPTAPVWAANRAARRDRDGVRALLKAAETLRKAQARALGGGAADELRTAQREERRAVQRLVAGAREALEDDGRTASADQLDRVERTLTAAAVDVTESQALEAGRLTRELEPGGFEALATLEPPPRRQQPSNQRIARSRESEQRRRRRRAAEQAVRETETRAREAEREAKRAARAAERAQVLAEKARAAADDAVAKLAAI